MISNESIQKPPNPREKCSILSVLTFLWTFKIFNIGKRRDIEITDLYEPLKEHSAGNLGKQFSDLWENEGNKNNVRLHKLILLFFKWQILSYLFLALLRECIIRVAQPILLGWFMSYYVPGQNHITKEESHWSALGLVVCSLLYTLIGHPCAMGVFHLGMKYRVVLCSLIYRKSLRLSKAALGQSTVGQMVNLLSNDMRRFDMGTVLLNYLIVSPIQMVIMTFFIWKEIGISSLIGIGGLVALIPFQFWMGKRISLLRAQTAVLTDKRIQLTNEVISGIQIIKMYAWENRFNFLICNARQQEMEKIQHTSYLKGINASFRMFNTRVCMFLSFVVYALLGNEVSSQKVFVTACFYEIMKQTMTVWFSDAVSNFKELMATFVRLENFLSKDEFTQSLKENSNINIVEKTKSPDETLCPLITPSESINNKPYLFSKSDEDNKNQDIKEESDSKIIMFIDELYAKWDQNHTDYTLRNITLRIKNGSLVAVTGPVGSGKSSLLYTILRELRCLSGQINYDDKISYSSQEPWLFAGTVKQNILFGSPMNSEKYQNVCSDCALKEDFESLPFGDMTYVGERGVTLSGGQKARINLARAVYHDADIYLLDDPLSAVDVGVGRHIFEKCILGILKKKTVLLVTHQLQYLNRADHVVVLKDGKIYSQGKFSDLQVLGNDFTKLFTKNIIDDSELLNSGLTSDGKQKDKNSLDKDLTDKKSKTNEYKEQRSTGTVNWKVYASYMKAGGPTKLLFIVLILAILAQFLASAFDYWTKYWVTVEEKIYSIQQNENITQSNKSSTSLDSFSVFETTTQVTNNYFSSTSWANITEIRFFYIGVYGGIVIFLILATLARSLTLYWITMKASITLHSKMCFSIVRSAMSFFHKNPSGRILNRFSQDIGTLDDLLPFLVVDVLQAFLQLIGIALIVSIVNVWLFIPMAIIVSIVYYIRNSYLVTSRSVQRLQGITRSPVFSHLSASMQGVVTIRALSAQNVVIKEFESHLDLYSSASHMFLGISRAFGYWLDLICVVFVGIVTASFQYSGEIIGGNIGLAITQAIGLTTMLQWGIRQATVLENQMISVERVREYSKIEPEPPLTTPQDQLLPEKWPLEGKIEFQNVFLRYSENQSPFLNSISFSIAAREKIGIVGRTGAGKTSIINALFRLAYTDGIITIDGTDICTIGLHVLRSKISIIPQEPVLFSGILRNNLDPFNEYNDEILWRSLEQVQMKSVILELTDGLNCNMAEGGSNFSVGQRQLICLARAIIHENKIIILDEATANVDNETDAVIQATIREKFSSCTIITIAHRLQTIMDSDKVLVMDAGKVVEFDNPLKLLDNENGFFSRMVEQTGKTTSEYLKGIAMKNNSNKD